MMFGLSRRFIECDSSADDSVIRPLQAAAFPSHIMEHRQNKVDELKEVVGNRDFSQGDTTGGVTAYKSISALQEAGNKLSRESAEILLPCISPYHRALYRIDQTVYDESRTFRVIGQNGSILYLSVNNPGTENKARRRHRRKPALPQGNLRHQNYSQKKECL